MTVLKAYTLNCVRQAVLDSGVGVGMKGGSDGKQPLPPLSIVPSCLSDSSPWSFGGQHTNALHRRCVAISIYKSRMSKSYKGKVRSRFSHLQDNLILLYMSARELKWNICNLHRKPFQLGPESSAVQSFYTPLLCCSALYYAPIPLSFHLTYPPPSLRLPTAITHLKLQLSWSLSTDAKANASGKKGGSLAYLWR